ncbi:hypothetical protein ACBQ69_22230, partial [Escherichia coli]
RDEWSHFLPESITDLPLVARHTSPSEIIILYYLTIPFGIGSKGRHGSCEQMSTIEDKNHYSQQIGRSKATRTQN